MYRSPVNEIQIKGFKTDGNVDVVMVGASDVYRFYYPYQAWKDAGITSYNYATPFGRLDLLKYYLEDIRSKNNQAELYVISVRTIFFMTDEIIEPTLRYWSDAISPTSLTRFKGINSYLFSRDVDISTLPSYYFDIIKYHSNKDALSSETNWSNLKGENLLYYTKGFSPGDNCEPFSKPTWNDNRIALNKRQSDALNAILDYCDKEKMNVLFTCCPISPLKEEIGIINTCGDIIEKRGYHFLNFNRYIDEIGLDFNTDYSDRNHANVLGAEKYTRFLVDYLKTNYSLTDHRGDPKYSHWDKEYENHKSYIDDHIHTATTIVDSIAEGKQIGANLKQKTDFYEWLSKIRNQNFTVIVRVNDIPETSSTDSHLYHFLSEFSLQPSKDHYIGLWNERSIICETYDNTSVESELSVPGGQARHKCKVSVDTGKIIIGNVDYTIADSNIQIVVYDNHYRNVVDNVALLIDPDGSVSLYRPKASVKKG